MWTYSETAMRHFHSWVLLLVVEGLCLKKLISRAAAKALGAGHNNATAESTPSQHWGGNHFHLAEKRRTSSVVGILIGSLLCSHLSWLAHRDIGIHVCWAVISVISVQSMHAFLPYWTCLLLFLLMLCELHISAWLLQSVWLFRWLPILLCCTQGILRCDYNGCKKS